MSDEKRDIFISYSHNDTKSVHRIAKDLKAQGLCLWLDEWDISPGANITKTINNGLSSSRYLLLFLSANSMASRWVEEEWTSKYYEEITKNKVTIIPVLIDKINFASLPPFISNKKIVDLSKDYKQTLKNTVNFLKKDIRSQNEQESLNSLKETMLESLAGKKRPNIVFVLSNDLILRLTKAKEKKLGSDQCLKIIFQEIEYVIKKISVKLDVVRKEYEEDPREFNIYHMFFIETEYDELVEFKEKLEFIKSDRSASEAILDQIQFELEIILEKNKDPETVCG